ncbi:MAG: MerR family transcriptional regulator [Pseudonocardiaceae bacterium]|nr:MerR family transcriptional regulator [Pseudonocardiaceae bacterium]
MSTVQIGQAAALYDLAPSALRWWERQGVFGEARHGNGRRQYGEDDLRRIGVAYLCHVTGMMSLDNTAIVASGTSDVQTWKTVVREQIAELGERIEQIRAARDYLHHLLDCQHDDMTQCAYLDDQIVAHTPRGRVAEPDIVTAARRTTR